MPVLQLNLELTDVFCDSLKYLLLQKEGGKDLKTFDQVWQFIVDIFRRLTASRRRSNKTNHLEICWGFFQPSAKLNPPRFRDEAIFGAF